MGRSRAAAARRREKRADKRDLALEEELRAEDQGKKLRQLQSYCRINGRRVDALEALLLEIVIQIDNTFDEIEEIYGLDTGDGGAT